jgi:hypothetical protein
MDLRKTMYKDLFSFPFVALISIFFIMGCGGGSGGGDGSVNYSGRWVGSLEVSGDTCQATSQGAPRFVGFDHIIDHNGQEVTIVSGNTILNGMMHDNNVLSASNEGNDGRCDTKIEITYLMNRDNPNDAQIVATEFTTTCPERTCRLSYAGEGRRVN